MKTITIKIAFLGLIGIHSLHAMQAPSHVKVNKVYLGKWENHSDHSVTIQTWKMATAQELTLKTLAPGETNIINAEIPIGQVFQEQERSWFLSGRAQQNIGHFDFKIIEHIENNNQFLVSSVTWSPLHSHYPKYISIDPKFLGKTVNIFVDGIIPATGRVLVSPRLEFHHVQSLTELSIQEFVKKMKAEKKTLEEAKKEFKLHDRFDDLERIWKKQ